VEIFEEHSYKNVALASIRSLLPWTPCTIISHYTGWININYQCFRPTRSVPRTNLERKRATRVARTRQLLLCRTAEHVFRNQMQSSIFPKSEGKLILDCWN